MPANSIACMPMQISSLPRHFAQAFPVFNLQGFTASNAHVVLEEYSMINKNVNRCC
jgi:hypothetical protein